MSSDSVITTVADRKINFHNKGIIGKPVTLIWSKSDKTSKSSAQQNRFIYDLPREVPEIYFFCFHAY